ncbi:MAG: glycosyltransferase [Polyangiaceae bacterium]|nr:glycosyltransferase [Polyangiaceae bacterium]
MDTWIDTVSCVALVVFAAYAYDVLISLAGLLPFPELPTSSKTRSFAVIICAHNEASVVEGVIHSLLAADYPKDKLRVFVVADNCTDETAKIARGAGAEVVERNSETDRTKGYALQFGIEHVKSEGPFDGLCVFDADNHVWPNYFRVLNDYLGEGHVAIQAYLDTKNPKESWVTRCIAIAYHVTNRFWLRARARLGLPTTLGGTGFCLAWNIIENYSWDPGSLADDLDLTVRLALHDINVSYCPHTRTEDEKPTTLKQSFIQRMRWMQGHNDVAFRRIAQVFVHAVRTPSLACVDVMLHLLQPLRLLLAFSSMVALITLYCLLPDHPSLVTAFQFTPVAIAVWAALFIVYPLVVASFEGVFWFALRNLIPSMLFAFTWIPAMALGLLRMRKRVWIHTTHASDRDPNVSSAPPQE